MEIHVRDIPYSCDHHTLTRRIAEILHRPPFSGITPGPANFHLWLFKNRRTGHGHSGSGALTLPSVPLGQAFMREYGEAPGNVPSRVLTITRRRVRFLPSKNVAKPDVVEQVSRLPYQDPQAIEDKEHKARELSTSAVPISTIQFGWECRDGVFSIEWEHDVAGRASASFSEENRELRVRIRHNDLDTLEIALRFSQIYMLCAHHYRRRHYAVYLQLASAPHFELARLGEKLRRRLIHLPYPDHDRVVAYTSLALRLVLPHDTALSSFRRLATVSDLSSRLTQEEVPVAQRGLFSVFKLNQLTFWKTNVPWIVAFQVEGLLRSLQVDAQEMLRLMPRVHKMSKDRGAQYTADFLVAFRNRVKAWWLPDDDSVETQISNLEGCWEQALAVHDRQFSKGSAANDQDPNVFSCLHVSVTPTSFALEGPFPEQSNRVIRTYAPVYHENFLRVSFQEEGRIPYRFDREVDGRSFIAERVGSLLHEGLNIAGHEFEFLAYSQSALKEHAVWFVRPFVHKDSSHRTREVSAASIIKSLGSFDDATRYCPARYAARISQAFTATDAAVVEVEEVLQSKDKETVFEGTKYCFTDGVGQLSLELAQDIWKQLRAFRKRINRSKGHPRAFQIRFGGSKGMLAVNHKLKGNTIVLRPSMTKFTASEQNVVEIARAFDRPGGYFLNRPLIMLLEGLGVPYEVFERYQDKAVAEVKEAKADVRGAAGLLERYGLGTSFRIPSVLNSLARLGIDHIIGDVFYDKVLEFAVNHILRDLKNHARIPVPQGWTLVGVVDEHDQLAEGEIFACVRPLDSNKNTYLEGPVLVSRSPTIHPGDVQVAYAIGRPKEGSPFAVEPLPNTVVFAAKGWRPLPSFLGGGDLDGDLYNLIPLKECPEFFPQSIYRPATYEPAEKKMLDRPATMRDVADFIVDYINSDVLGIIAINWLVTADQTVVLADQQIARGGQPLPHGILSSDCLLLSQLHSNAVDFPKSGQPVPLDQIPRLPLRAKARPDWNAPETVTVEQSPNYYPSTRAIGRLFRRVDLRELKPGREQRRQARRLRRALRIEADDLADMLSETTLSDAGDDPVLSAIEDRVLEFIDIDEPALPEQAEAIAQLFARYVGELQSICATQVLTHRRQAMLTEEEATIGTIIEKTSMPRKRKELMAKLRERTDYLVRDVREELAAAEEEDFEVALRRAWIAWKLALREEKAFGAKSFGWIALGSLFETIKEIEDAVKSNLRNRGYD
ncbi:RNA-directed RNA polymerase 2 [Vararia minispora EC-137]|uniref:RNA-directed RNA polymerase 2 n=1 Tax=Vararia minispora EC-137 TaxID=1314806 RepID=A0ACB8QND5_9AGAM|nr:RNA-directed RNA polymerase 2 [Vararia minispora EC-137]